MNKLLLLLPLLAFAVCARGGDAADAKRLAALEQRIQQLDKEVATLKARLDEAQSAKPTAAAIEQLLGIRPAAKPAKPISEKQAKANTTLEELRQLDMALDQWGIEMNKRAGDKPTPAELRPYIKAGTRLYNTLGDPDDPKDILGNPYGPFVLDEAPKVNPKTLRELSDAVPREFWEPFLEKK